ncbi:MAG TPA: flagellar export chaperone FliS [Hyphomicrobiales bacterium]|nr:flagellar export chaperone FliS [Hyphomicrobiales bacterium]
MHHLAALNQYQHIDVESRVNHCTPHMLIGMLYEGALKKIALASGATRRGDVQVKGNAIGSALRIIDSLRAALDHERGGDVADNLEALYSYMERRLLEANVKSDAALLDEVSTLLQQIKSGWEAIPTEQREG